MKNLAKLFFHFAAVGVLTIVTQIGGLIYLITLGIKAALHLNKARSMGVFLATYLLTSFALLPLIAPIFGRAALPLMGTLRPLNIGTCILNRHYVKPHLKRQMQRIADKMNVEFEGTITNYLDANFPFFNGFPLFPHLSHNDGRKLDLAFYYKEDNKPSVSAPSFMGYGVYEQPKNNESNYPATCQQKGYWQYGLLSAIVPQWNKKDFQLDVERTRALIRLLAQDQSTSKIFIEPHLKQRWQLHSYENIRFHGCQAVRHDDHIHTQIK